MLQGMENDVLKLKEQFAQLESDNKSLHDQLLNLQHFDRLSLLSDLAFEGIFFHRNGICIEVNQALCNMTGYSREEFIGKDITDILFLNELKVLFYENSQLEYSKPNRVKIKKKDNSELTVEIESKHFEYEGTNISVTAVRDISEKIKAEVALAESEDRYRIAFKINPDAININKLDGTYVDINDGFTKLTGFTKDDVIGKTSKEINIWAKTEDRNKLIDELKTTGLVENLEILFQLKDGTTRTGLMSARLLKINNELHILSITRDISQRKEIENELIAAKEKAEESDRLKSAFLANMSHEIRTPMNGLVGFVELLVQDDITYEKRMFYKNVINESCNRLLNIINDILDISKIETKQIRIVDEEINLNDFILETYSVFLSQIKNKNLGIDLIRGLKDSESFIITDSQKLNQIFNNLINNAIKFTNRGNIEIGYKITPDGFILFHVKDTGIGISKEQQDIIFQRFRQIDISNERLYGGTGLGLAIAKGFVELLNGKIWCESSPLKGSAFYFTIPYRPGKRNSGDTSFINQDNIDTDFKTILIAEDEEVNFLYIEEILHQLDKVNILRAVDGNEVVEIVKNKKPIDLILMDIKMPFMNGFDATKLIKKTNPDIIIIAQTAYAMASDKKMAFDAGCDAYLSKPIQKDKLIAMVKSFLF